MAEPLDPDLLREVQALIAEAAGVSPAEVTPAGLLIGWGIDSVRAVELLDAANARFGVTLDDGDLAKLSTVADVVRRIQARRGAP